MAPIRLYVTEQQPDQAWEGAMGKGIRQVSILSNVSRDISAQRAIRRVEKIAFFPLPPQEPEKSG